MLFRMVGMWIALTTAFPLHAEVAQQFEAQCVVCHGAQAQGNPSLKAPALAGQSAAYVQRQLKGFQSEWRGEEDAIGQSMRAVVGSLSDQDITALAEHVSSLAPLDSSNEASDPALLKQGQTLYQSYCGSCHGSNAQGYEALSTPNLALLDGEYLRRQYELYLAGKRGSNRQDRLGRQMAMMARAVTDDADIDAIIRFIESLPLAQ